MNTNQTEPATNANVILIIVLTLGINGTIGMATLAYCMIYKVEPNTTLLTAFVGMVNFILGGLAGMLVKTSPTEATKQPLPQPPHPPPTTETPTPVQVVNQPTNPVPTTEEPPK